MVPTTRRQVLRRGLVCGTVGLAGCVSGPAEGGRATHISDVDLPRAATWPTYRYDTANTGYNPEARGPTGEVEIAWRYNAHTEAESGAVVSNGRVYAGSLIVDGQTGRRNGGNWGGHYSTPTVADGTVYVGSHDLEVRDATTGSHQWTFETEGDAGALPATTVADGTVYVPGGIKDPTLYAIDAETGTERWRFEADADIGVPAAVVEGVVYTVDRRNTVYAIDGATGDERWRTPRDVEVFRSAPVVTDDRLYFGAIDEEEYLVLALGTDQGELVWRQQPDLEISSPVAVADGTVFATGRDGAVAALDAARGRPEWTRSLVDGAFTELGVPAMADGVVYVGVAHSSEPAPLFALDGTTGEELWRIETRAVSFGDYTVGGVSQGPAVVDDLVYVATPGGDLYAIRER